MNSSEKGVTILKVWSFKKILAITGAFSLLPAWNIYIATMGRNGILPSSIQPTLLKEKV